jgi:O-antigen ligase/tetratricopeptide (TPR) repeat protein
LTAAVLVRHLVEGIVLLMVCGSPWAFGAEEPVFEFILAMGLAALSLLWGLRGVLEGRPLWAGGASAWCLGGLVLLAAVQVAPLPQPLLRLVSPGTARLHEDLWPREREALPDGTFLPAPAPTISLYPGATRRVFFWLLSFFLFFGVVRNNLASLGARRRLLTAVFVNGVLLALLGILQHVTPTPNKGLYWAVPVPAPGFFGPFLSRNSYSYYADLCFGPGLALVLASSGGFGLAGLARSPKALWGYAGLAVLFTTIVLCQSRGGLVSFVVAAGVCTAVGVARSSTLRPAVALAATAVAAFLLLSGAGFEWEKTRLLTLTDSEALHASSVERTNRWWGVVPMVKECPVFGTGYGTFTSLEVGHLPPELLDRLFTLSAHNEYVQYFIEGGAITLLLIVLLLAHLLRRGYRAAGSPDPADRDLAFGGAFSLITIAVHSFFNGFLLVPAIAALTAVTCAHLDALSPAPDGELTGGRVPGRRRFLLAGTVALFLAGLGVAVLAYAYRVYQAQQYLMAAYGMRDCPGRPVTAEYRLACLEAAEQWLPDNARLQVELGQAHFRLHQRNEAAWDLPARTGGALANLFSLPDVVGGPVLAAASARPDSAGGRPPAHLTEALRHYLRARDLCPLLAKAHLRIAAHVEALGRAGPRGDYLRRAQSLLPQDPELWYRSGIQEAADGRTDEAVADWRRSLELSGAYLVPILRRARKHLGPQEMETRLLPDKPVVLARAADELYPGAAPSAGRARLQERAVRLLAKPTEPLSAEEWHLKARLHRALGQLPEAVAAYQAALLRKPRENAWRLDLARALLRQGQGARARQELLTVLQHDPGNPEAKGLLAGGRE